MNKIQMKTFRYYLGNSLILISLLILGFIYYPYFSLYFSTPDPQVLSNSQFSITIPKIRAQAPVIENVNPWAPSDYQPSLERGVAEASGSALPGERGNIFLFAHSSQPPWKLTRLNTSFLRLGELNFGDQIILNKDGKRFIYEVKDKKEVWPNEVKYLQEINQSTSSDTQTLILQTCTPIGTSLKRLLVFAQRVS
ncbi:MAG: sortase [bacterium]|nr:sortase [bacterium]